MTNRYITTKIKIKNIGDLTVNPNYNYSNNSNRSIIRVEFITNELDMYTMESIPKYINVILVNNKATVFDRTHRYEVRHALQGTDTKPLFDSPYY